MIDFTLTNPTTEHQLDPTAAAVEAACEQFYLQWRTTSERERHEKRALMTHALGAAFKALGVTFGALRYIPLSAPNTPTVTHREGDLVIPGAGQ